MTTNGDKRNALVTGATGFIGSHIVNELLCRGYSVTCLVRPSNTAKNLQKLPCRVVTGDLEDLSSLRGLGEPFHEVYHTAGAIKAATRDGFFAVNCKGTRRLLETIAETCPSLRRFVHISSLAAAGPGSDGNGLTEQETPNPVSWYGESKLAAEQEAMKFSTVFPVVILRPSAVYGPGDKETLLIFRMIARGVFITPGRAARHFSLIHVHDLVEAIMRAATAPVASGELINISGPEPYRWEDIGRMIAHTLGRKYRRLALPAWTAGAAGIAGDIRTRITGRPSSINSQKVKELLSSFWVCDVEKSRKLLDFSPRIDLEKGIRETAEWYRCNGWL
ncbi:MAG TPA: NAD-dependent epimerase/dehydratase family protein [Acidobacteriota bacterium]|nr:NAD-dependent epimerase/dehydratase family protein [Acidobacteriota bacterium]